MPQVSCAHPIDLGCEAGLNETVSGDTTSTGIKSRKTNRASASATEKPKQLTYWPFYLDSSDNVHGQLMESTSLDQMLSDLSQENGLLSNSAKRKIAINHYYNLKSHPGQPAVCPANSIPATRLREVCQGEISTDITAGLFSSIEEKFTSNREFTPMNPKKLANRLCRETDNLFLKLFTEPELFGSSSSTMGSVSRFLARHGVYPTIVHQLFSSAGNYRNFMVIPTQSTCYLICNNRHWLKTKQYLSNSDLSVLSSMGITCKMFIYETVEPLRTKLCNTLCLFQYPNLLELYQSSEMFLQLERVGNLSTTQVQSKVIFLASKEARDKLSATDIPDHPLPFMAMLAPSLLLPLQGPTVSGE